MATFRDFSGRNVGFVQRFVAPRTLAQLRSDVLNAEAQCLPIHAVGSAWAFSAPAYSPGVVVDTQHLNFFPASLQGAINSPERGAQVLVAAAAGIRVVDLYGALSGMPRADSGPLPGVPMRDRGPGVPPALLRDSGGHPRTLTPRTLGGAGGQSIAGAISTGTHGGDVARGPIGDFVRAIVMVGSQGQVRLIQRPGSAGAPPVVDFARLSAALRTELPAGASIVELADDDVFDAALVSVGRFGVVYAYVLEVEDDTNSVLVEHRTESTWATVRSMIAGPGFLGAERSGDEFLQVLINPFPQSGGTRRCWITRRKQMPRASVGNAGARFGLPGVASTPLSAERSGGGGPLGNVMQSLCQESQTDVTRALSVALFALAIIALGVPFVGIFLALPLFEASRTIARIGPGYKIGDAVADVINSATAEGLPQVLELVEGAALAGGQPLQRRDGGPWLVHGQRWELADLFDYTTDCFRGDSVEIFFAVDSGLAGKIDGVLRVLDNIRAAGTPVGAYVALRFMSQTPSLIGMAAFAPHTCSIEVSMLRGLRGNDRALADLQALAIASNGRIHWGQQNDLDRAAVDRMYGSRVARWRNALLRVEGTSGTFSNPFTVRAGLEPDRPAAFAGWTALPLVAGASPAVAPAGAGMPLEVFALDRSARVIGLKRNSSGGDPPPRAAASTPLDPNATPSVIRARDGRIEICARGRDGSLTHCWEQGRPGGDLSGWDTFWGPRALSDPQIASHIGGRLEVFAQELDTSRRLLHAWQRWTGGPWSAAEPLGGTQHITSRPSACLRAHLESVSVTDQLLAVSTNESGQVIWMSQSGPSGDTGWTGWNVLAAPGTPAVTTGGPPIAVPVSGAGAAVHVFAVDSHGQVQEAQDADRTVAVTWQPWRPLPALPCEQRLNPRSRLATAQASTLWLFGHAERGNVMAIELTPGAGWGSWIDLGGNIAGDLAAGSLDDGRIELFGRRASDDFMMARRQVARNRWT